MYWSLKRLMEKKENNKYADEYGITVDVKIKEEILTNTHNERKKTTNKWEQSIKMDVSKCHQRTIGRLSLNF